MKKYLITLIPVLVLSLQPELPSGGQPIKTVSVTYSEGDLKPTVSQEKVEALVAKLLTTYHYRKVRLNDSLSSAVWDHYIKDVDPGKTYLLQSDLDGMEKYRDQIDDALVNGDLTAAYDLYNLFRKRFAERSAFIKEQLKQPFSFTANETFDTDREKAVRPKTVEEQNELWRKILKNQALELKLGNRSDSAVTATMTDRYKNLDRAIERMRSIDVFQIYMNAFSESLDPHTNYFSPSNADRFNQEMSQSLEGIGAMLREDGDYVKITDVLPGGPAFKSKQLVKDDRVVGVAQGDNGAMVNTVNWRVDDVVKLIKGPKGTVVRLQVLSADAIAGAPPKEIRLVREKIKLEEQRAKKELTTITEKGRTYKLGVINIPMFYRDFEGARKHESGYSSTTSDVRKFIEELNAEKVDGIVIDLRDNGGGSLTEAIDLTGLFIPKGPVVQVKEPTGNTEVYSDRDGGSVAYNGPLAVLVNRFSASASEIFAAAIQDYKRGVIVGGQTYGKGTVQTLVDLNDWMPRDAEKVGQVKMTVQKFYRINGSSTQRRGVTPDVEFPSPFSEEEYGESSQPSALPWDQINSAKYDPTNQVSTAKVAQLQAYYDQRLKTESDLKQLSQELDEIKKAKEKTVVSLQESTRRKERDDAIKKRDAARKAMNVSVSATSLNDDDDDDSEDAAKPATKKEAATPKTGTIAAATPAKAADKKDTYLRQAELVLVDFINLDKK